MTQSVDAESKWPRSLRTIFLWVLAATLVFALPLSYRQFDPLRLSFLLYPVQLLGFGLFFAWAIRRIASHRRTSRPAAPEYLLLAAALLSAGHSSAWFATVLPYPVMGWRGTILMISFGPALISLLGALWSAFGVRVFNQPSRSRMVLLVLGWLAIVGAWLFAEYAYWTFYAAGSGRHRPFWAIIGLSGNARYGLYASVEALYWQAVWPLLWVFALGSRFAKTHA